MEPFNFCLPSHKKTHTLVQTHVGEHTLNLRWRLQNACLKQHKLSEALLTVKRKVNELCIICYTQSVSVQAVSLLLVSFFNEPSQQLCSCFLFLYSFSFLTCFLSTEESL